MDTTLIEVYRRLVRQFRCSAEDILEDPELRNAFLREARQALNEEVAERQLLHRLSYLRKQRRLPRLRDLVGTD
jgi:hypothetical protein